MNFIFMLVLKSVVLSYKYYNAGRHFLLLMSFFTGNSRDYDYRAFMCYSILFQTFDFDPYPECVIKPAVLQ